jgi:hypothetical protein
VRGLTLGLPRLFRRVARLERKSDAITAASLDSRICWFGWRPASSPETTGQFSRPGSPAHAQDLGSYRGETGRWPFVRSDDAPWGVKATLHSLCNDKGLAPNASLLPNYTARWDTTAFTELLEMQSRYRSLWWVFAVDELGIHSLRRPFTVKAIDRWLSMQLPFLNRNI